MTKTRLLGVAFAISGSFLSLFVGQAHAAFIIDDFNVNTTSSISDFTPGSIFATTGSVIDGSNTVMGGTSGWTRTLWADLSVGDRLDTTVCSNCQTGHVTMNANDSNGVGTFQYVGGLAVDLSSYTGLQFDWAADQAGASVEIWASDSTNSGVIASWSGLASTGGTTPGDLVTQATMAISWGLIDSTSIDEIRIIVSGVPNLDSSIDNITAVVPIPAAVWLFGSGLLGLAGVAKRKKA